MLQTSLVEDHGFPQLIFKKRPTKKRKFVQTKIVVKPAVRRNPKRKCRNKKNSF